MIETEDENVEDTKKIIIKKNLGIITLSLTPDLLKIDMY